MKTPHEYACEQREIADKYAAHLVLTYADEPKGEKVGRYMLRRRKGFGFFGYSWVEVVVLHGGHLLVHGDVDACIFGYCNGYASARDVLHWMTDARPGYAREKASIGSSGKIATEWDRDVAEWYISEWVSEARVTEEAGAELRRALDDGQQSFIEQLRETEDLDIDDYCAGEVTSRTVFAAQGCLRRLLAELGARDMCSAARAWFRRVAA